MRGALSQRGAAGPAEGWLGRRPGPPQLGARSETKSAGTWPFASESWKTTDFLGFLDFAQFLLRFLRGFYKETWVPRRS